MGIFCFFLWPNWPQFYIKKIYPEHTTKGLPHNKIILLVHIGLIIAASFSGLVFYFDDNNIYHRGPGYLLSNLCPLVLLAIDTYLLCKYRKRMARSVRVALWLYIIIPVLGILIQSFTYDIQFISIATIITAVNMFLVSIQYQPCSPNSSRQWPPALKQN